MSEYGFSKKYFIEEPTQKRQHKSKGQQSLNIQYSSKPTIKESNKNLNYGVAHSINYNYNRKWFEPDDTYLKPLKNSKIIEQIPKIEMDEPLFNPKPTVVNNSKQNIKTRFKNVKEPSNPTPAAPAPAPAPPAPAPPAPAPPAPAPTTPVQKPKRNKKNLSKLKTKPPSTPPPPQQQQQQPQQTPPTTPLPTQSTPQVPTAPKKEFFDPTWQTPNKLQMKVQPSSKRPKVEPLQLESDDDEEIQDTEMARQLYVKFYEEDVKDLYNFKDSNQFIDMVTRFEDLPATFETFKKGIETKHPELTSYDQLVLAYGHYEILPMLNHAYSFLFQGNEAQGNVRDIITLVNRYNELDSSNNKVRKDINTIMKVAKFKGSWSDLKQIIIDFDKFIN